MRGGGRTASTKAEPVPAVLVQDVDGIQLSPIEFVNADAYEFGDVQSCGEGKVQLARSRRPDGVRLSVNELADLFLVCILRHDPTQ
jgi:hypothetical protein